MAELLRWMLLFVFAWIVFAKLNTLLRLARESKGREAIMSVQMDDLIVAVNENTSLDDSIITFLNGLADQLADAAGDKDKAIALAEEVRAKTAAVAAALAANTAPPVEPPVS
jgi:hypothetical protein